MHPINCLVLVHVLMLNKVIISTSRNVNIKRLLNEYDEMSEYGEHPIPANDYQNHDELENLNRFNQELEDANLENINFEIQYQAAKLNKLTEDDAENHELVEQTEVDRDPPTQQVDEHYIENPNYDSKYTVDQPNEEEDDQRQQAPESYQQPNSNDDSQNEQQQQNPNSDSQSQAQDDSQNNNSQDGTQSDSQKSQNSQNSDDSNSQSNSTISSTPDINFLPNLTSKGKFGQTPIHNNIFVIQAACGKQRKTKKRKQQSNQADSRSGKKLKKRKTKRKRKRQKKKLILIEEYNYVPAYKKTLGS